MYKDQVPEDVFNAFGQSVYIDPALRVLDKTKEDIVDMTSGHSTKGTPADASAMVSTRNVQYRGQLSLLLFLLAPTPSRIDILFGKKIRVV